MMSAPGNKICILLLIALLWQVVDNQLFAQCGGGVPTFVVDLSGNPDTTWFSPDTNRFDTCCGASAPDVCIAFVLTLDTNATGIVLDICSGAIPGGALFYQVSCGPPVQVGQVLCLNGPGPHFITFCKPGNNQNIYCITSIPKAQAGPNTVVNDGCTSSIWSTGFEETSIEWTSVFPGVTGTYDSLLSCTLGCDTTVVTGGPNYPPFIDYQVCGLTIGGCDPVFTCDTLRVFLNSTLAVNINPTNPTVCFGDTSTTITAIGAGGSPPYRYSWNTGDTTQSINVNVGTYIVEMHDSSNCPPTYDTVTVTSFANPISANAGPDQNICTQDFPVQLAGVVTGVTQGQWLGGGGSYSPDDLALNASYTPSSGEISAGIATLLLATLNNGSCPPDTDTVVINIHSFTALLSMGTTNVTCYGLDNGTATVTISGGASPFTYQWDTAAGSQTTPTATSLAPGTYLVTVTNTHGCDTVLTATITEPPPLTATINAQTNVSCSGGSNGSASVLAGGGTTPYGYLWSNGQTTATATSLSAGTYTATVSDNNGCTVTETVTITEPALFSVNSSPLTHVLCFGENDGSAYSTATGGVSPYNFLWSNGSTNDTITNLFVGSYSITATDANGCTSTNSVVITEPPLLTSGITGIMHVSCFGGNDGYAATTTSGGTTPYTYLWNTGQSTDSVNNLVADTISVTVTDANNCQVVDSAIINEPTELQLSALFSNVSCFGGNNGFAAVIPSGGVQPYQYQWGPGTGFQTAQTAIGLSIGTYLVTVTDQNGCSRDTSVIIQEPDSIILTTISSDTLCIGDQYNLEASASGGNGGYTYSWDQGLGNGQTHSVSPTSTTIYNVQVFDSLGCTGNPAHITVVVFDLLSDSMDVTSTGDVCAGETTLIKGFHNGIYGPYTYQWNFPLTGLGPFFEKPQNTTTYKLSIIDVCGNEITDSVIVNVSPIPELRLPFQIAAGCAPLSVQFRDIWNSIPGLTYDWSFGDGTSSTEDSATKVYSIPGTYQPKVVITSPAGCTVSDSGNHNVFVYEVPESDFFATPEITSLLDPTISFMDASMGADHWKWLFGNGDSSNVQHPQYTYQDTGNYRVSLITKNDRGCLDTLTRRVLIKPHYTLDVPNAFTPNPNGPNGGSYNTDDLSNDIFYPFTEFVDNYHLMIFNRWGELLFESFDINIGWDGYYRGKLCQQDVYAYKLKISWTDGRSETKVGDVTLIR